MFAWMVLAEREFSRRNRVWWHFSGDANQKIFSNQITSFFQSKNNFPFQIGRQEGREEEGRDGRQEGRKEGGRVGRKEGRQEGEGRKEGRQAGRKEGRMEAI